MNPLKSLCLLYCLELHNDSKTGSCSGCHTRERMRHESRDHKRWVRWMECVRRGGSPKWNRNKKHLLGDGRMEIYLRGNPFNWAATSNLTLHWTIFYLKKKRKKKEKTATTNNFQMSRLINFKIWSHEQVNKFHNKTWLRLWIPYVQHQNVIWSRLHLKDKFSLYWITVLFIWNSTEMHLFTTGMTSWITEHIEPF